MPLSVFRVDAFASTPFAGNPAAVCPLAGWLDDGLLQAVAAENNLSETAFFVPSGEHYELRWFTPRCEVKLCGHATLASAFVLLQILETNRDSVHFETRSSGALTVSRNGELLAMDFPSLVPWTCAAPPAALIEGLGKLPASVVHIEDNYFAVYEREDDVRSICPDLRLLEKLHPAGVAITAPGENSDLVSRYFAPSYGIREDAVTGSTHCSLAPYWAQRLSKTNLHARQVSERGGEVWCEVKGKRVILKGNAVLTLRGELLI
ncbi:MAG TPA: PhzF family phenazine biosynthesis protein [Candidatus Acidoferrum sp.]|jgi:PhzF family phenazine biosynthesis protein|nr:PhzF family phenazine biosynthesis protein [Candidatus Acidoferrum sp.]